MNATYRLTGRIETGELAELHEGLQLPATEVVVKLFHPKTSDPAYALDLAETTRLLQPVRHPGILHVVDIGVVRQRLAVVREDLEGFTLGTALQRLHTKEVVLPPAVALHIVIQLLEAVQQAHDAGVLHGALTPGNVVLSRDGMPAVCDFGALRALMAVPQLRRSFANRGRGTYRSPEVSRGEAYSEQSDVYSLGAIAYELLTQREPVIAGGGGVSTRRSETLPPPSRLDRRINSRLDSLILRALEPSTQRRFRSCGEFASSLRNFLSASGGMPGLDDVRRFVGELFPNEVSMAGLGPAPFKESFTLEPISGAEMDLRAEEPEASIVQRAPYSRPLSPEEEAGADTQEAAAPAFEAYRPEDYEPEPAPSSTHTRAPAPPVGEGETTGPGQAGPLERGWDAPPGAAPARPRRQVIPQAGANRQQGARVGARNPRVKVMEDFSGPAPSEEAKEQSVSISTSGRRTVRPLRPQDSPAPERGARPLPELFPTSARVEAKERADMAVPAPSGPGLDAAASRRLMTEEQNLFPATHRRGRMVALAAALALVGLFSFVIAAWRLGGKPGEGTPAVLASPEEDPTLGQGPSNPVPVPQPARPTAPPPEPSRTEPSRQAGAQDVPEEDTAPEPKPPPKSQRAYVTITTNVPAQVYIDGERVNRRTPLSRFPIKAGTRLIRLVSVATGEPQEMELRFTRGQHRKLVVDSFSAPRR